MDKAEKRRPVTFHGEKTSFLASRESTVLQKAKLQPPFPSSLVIPSQIFGGPHNYPQVKATFF